jgi:hypothetical protein
MHFTNCFPGWLKKSNATDCNNLTTSLKPTNNRVCWQQKECEEKSWNSFGDKYEYGHGYTYNISFYMYVHVDMKEETYSAVASRKVLGHGQDRSIKRIQI